MNYTIDKTMREPAYLQLYRFLVSDIESGVIPFGGKLPSKRTLAEETGVSVITAEHAVMLLEEEGYVESRQRSGSFVIYRDDDFLKSPEHTDSLSAEGAEQGGSFSLNDPEHTESSSATGPQQLHSIGDFPFSLLAKTMRKVLSDYGERIMVKSPNHGCPELREEICRYLARSRGLSLQASQVIIGSGAEYLYGLIVQLLGTEQTYALEKPSYSKIQKVYQSMGAVCEMLTMTPSGIRTSELAGTKAKILHVTPFNSFPSGVTAGVSKKKEYLQWARKNGGVIIEDNYDSELTVSRKMEESLYAMDQGTNVIYLNTFSRTVAPSARIGYMILPERLTETFNERLGFYSCTVPIFEQYVLAELLKNGDYERHINRIRRKKRKAMLNLRK